MASWACGTAASVDPWNNQPTRSAPSAPPTTSATRKAGTEAGAIPAKVSERVRASVTAGLAKLVELVNQ